MFAKQSIIPIDRIILPGERYFLRCSGQQALFLLSCRPNDKAVHGLFSPSGKSRGIVCGLVVLSTKLDSKGNCIAEMSGRSLWLVNGPVFTKKSFPFSAQLVEFTQLKAHTYNEQISELFSLLLSAYPASMDFKFNYLEIMREFIKSDEMRYSIIKAKEFDQRERLILMILKLKAVTKLGLRKLQRSSKHRSRLSSQ